MPALPDAAVEVRRLRKAFGRLVAVDGLDLRVRTGTCFGLLGPNGAGKTTTIEILEGLQRADDGEVRVLGLGWPADGAAIRERIGVQLQETRFPDKLTVLEILRLFRSFYRRGPEPTAVLELVGLMDKRDTRTVNLSGGQRQRLALGCALVNDPELLFLDEPTTGLDPQARRRVWEIVEGLKTEGRTVLLTTHYMDEAEALADELMIIDHGRSIAEGAPRAIIDSLHADSVISLETGVDGAQPGPEELQSLSGVLRVRSAGGRIEIDVRNLRQSLPGLLDLCRARGVQVDSLETHRPTLEDVFVSLTGRHLRDG